MAHADDSTYMGMGDGSIIGCFVEEECGNFFEYSHNPDYVEPTEDVQRFLLEGRPNDITTQYPHLVWVINEGHFMRDYMGGFRYAKVLKTRAKVVVDEDENGLVIETWKFKGQKPRVYDRRQYGEYNVKATS